MKSIQNILTHRQSVEQIISLLLRLRFKDLDVLENLSVDVHFLVKPHRVFTQKVEDDLVGRLQGDVLVSQRTTTDSIGLIFAFLVTSSQSQTIDEIQCRRSLTISHDFRLEILRVVFSDLIDVFLPLGLAIVDATHMF